MARMTGRHAWLIGGVVAFVAAGFWFFGSRSQDHLIFDLMAEFPNAKKQPPDVFSVLDATIAKSTRPAVFVAVPSRLTFQRVVLPENAWLRVSLGVKEEGWTMPGDGVTFGIVISDGKSPVSVMNLELNPFTVSADRGWRDELLDLSEFAGETVDVIFNTRAGSRNDTNGDLALWGSPRIVVR
jgi:hypothetical protein